MSRLVKVRDYGQGLWEAVISEARSVGSRLRRIGRKKANLPLKEESIDRGSRRAKARVRRLVMSAQLTYLLSLTYRYDPFQPLTDRRMVYRHLHEFCREMVNRVPDWPYVATIEPHKSGSLHVHLAVKGFQQVALIREIWQTVIGKDGFTGNIDVEPPRGRKGGEWRSNSLGRYLSKYIGKDMDTGRNYGEHRYFAALGIEVPCEEIYWEGKDHEELLKWLLHRMPTGVAYYHEFSQCVYMCSW